MFIKIHYYLNIYIYNTYYLLISKHVFLLITPYFHNKMSSDHIVYGMHIDI